MTLLIGIDEAGYGPNLGPLCIGATAWEVSAVGREQKAEGEVDLYELLAEIVSPTIDGRRIAIADSKQLYKPASHANGHGLLHLERAVHTALEMLDRPTADLHALLSLPELPWYADYNCPLPIDADSIEVMTLIEQWEEANHSAGVRLLDAEVRMVFPEEFNELTEHYGTKGAALSHVSIELVKNLVTRHQPISAHHTAISCDKHGGRNRYGALLQHHFSDEWIETIEESRPASRYRWGSSESRTEICFRTKGESELPVALASMMAKYYRELAMRAFNAFWTAQVPGLKPTAGYPQDAKRFKKEIAAVQSRLGINDRILWRNR